MSGQSSQLQAVCQHCGKTFSVQYPSRLGRKFCSRECRNAWRKPRVERDCLHCGATFQLNWPTSTQQCCSRMCADAYRSSPTLEERFWSRVQKGDGCWLWTGCLDPKGYGRFGIGSRGKNRQYFLAPRFALSLALGRPLQPGEQACHGCDNPACVRVGPGHIFLGTQKDNIQDAMSKGRMHLQKPGVHKTFKRRKGTTHHNAKLNPDKVRRIRQLREQGWSQQKIADLMGVRQCTIYSVLNGETWTHVK